MNNVNVLTRDTPRNIRTECTNTEILHTQLHFYNIVTVYSKEPGKTMLAPVSLIYFDLSKKHTWSKCNKIECLSA